MGVILPTVLRWGPYRAFFYSNEGSEPAHVHVRAGDREVKVWLHALSVAMNAGFPAHEITGILGELRTNREMLLNAWHEHFGN